MSRRVGFVINPLKSEAFPLARQLAHQAAESSAEVLVEAPAPCEIAAMELPLEELAAKADVILILGGDGTMLRVARVAAPAGKPMLGIHFGHYGFIMETEPQESANALRRVLAGDYEISSRLMLRTEVLRGGEPVGTHVALNDIVIAHGLLSRLLRLSVAVRQREVVRYSADGLIIATPTGSTAYSLSAGGPVIHPDVDAIALTPIAPHTLTARALVIPANESFDVTVTGDSARAVLTVDGQIMEQVEEGDIVRVARAPFCAHLVTMSQGAFYRQLDSRLGFGKRFEG